LHAADAPSGWSLAVATKSALFTHAFSALTTPFSRPLHPFLPPSSPPPPPFSPFFTPFSLSRKHSSSFARPRLLPWMEAWPWCAHKRFILRVCLLPPLRFNAEGHLAPLIAGMRNRQRKVSALPPLRTDWNSTLFNPRAPAVRYSRSRVLRSLVLWLPSTPWQHFAALSVCRGATTCRVERLAAPMSSYMKPGGDLAWADACLRM